MIGKPYKASAIPPLNSYRLSLLALAARDEAAAHKKQWDTRGRSEQTRTQTPEHARAAATQPIVRYHGTIDAAVESIKQHGLIAKKGKGGDAWWEMEMQRDPFGMEPLHDQPKRASVFFTDREDFAGMMAMFATEVNPGTKPVVIELHIPPVEHAKSIKSDKSTVLDYGISELRPAKVPKEWVARVGDLKCPPPKRPDERPEPKDCQIACRLSVTASGDQILYAVLLVQEPQQLRDEAEAHRKAWDTRGRKGETQVGITSARPEKPNRLVFAQMREFTGQLEHIPSVSNVHVQPGVGVWQDFDTKKILSEPTWVVSYTGNGAARRLLAETGKKYQQDAVLIMSGASASSDAMPSVEMTFEKPLSGSQQKAIIGLMAEHGITGATWFKSGGKTMLRAVAVPQWGMEATAHLKAAGEVGAILKQRGLHYTQQVKRVHVDIIERSGDHSYDSVLNAPHT